MLTSCAPLSSLPPHTAHPLNPPRNHLRLLLIPLHPSIPDQLHRIVVPRQLLITRQPMHKAMTRPAQPRDAIQHLLAMPAPLPHPVVRALRYQVVVRQRDPVPVAQLALCRAGGGPDRGREGGGGAVGREDGREQVVRVVGVAGGGEQGVGFQAVDCVRRDRREEVCVCGRGEGRRVGVLQRGGVAVFRVGEGAQGRGERGEEETAEVLWAL